MGSYLRAGSLADDWTNPNIVSMAKDMEDELAKLLVQFPPDDDPTPRRKLLIAIATGVINHLKKNEDAFSIPVSGLTPVHPTITVLP